MSQKKLRTSIFDTLHFDDKDYMFDYVENVVIGHVFSIDTGSNYNEVDEVYYFPYTLGKFAVPKSIKGDLKEGEIYTYARSGCILPAEEFYAQYEDGGEKIKRMTETNPDYIAQFPKKCKQIEVGTTYLIYLVKSERFKHDTYVIYGFDGGMREIDQLFPEDYADIKVLNNFTEEWENITDVVPGL